MVFAADDGDFTLWAVHLKSKLTESDDADDPQSAGLRAAEAMAVRRTVLEKFPDPATARFAILGDFNDGKGSKTLQDLLRRGRAEITSAVPAADSHGEVWTEFYAKQEIYSGFDHVLVSPGLRGAVRDRRAVIFDAPEVSLASDHRPVVVTLEFPTGGVRAGREYVVLILWRRIILAGSLTPVIGSTRVITITSKRTMFCKGEPALHGLRRPWGAPARKIRPILKTRRPRSLSDSGAKLGGWRSPRALSHAHTVGRTRFRKGRVLPDATLRTACEDFDLMAGSPRLLAGCGFIGEASSPGSARHLPVMGAPDGVQTRLQGRDSRRHLFREDGPGCWPGVGPMGRV